MSQSEPRRCHTASSNWLRIMRNQEKFCLRIAASAAASPDAIAGLLLKLCARVSTLEHAAKTQALQLAQLSRQSQALLPAGLLAPPPPGFAAEPGAPERPAGKPPGGRPKGRRDSHPRRTPLREPGDTATRWLIDHDFDSLGG